MKSPIPRVDAQMAVIGGGMDLVTSPMMAKPGAARLVYNYEYTVSGGVDRIRGIEPIDGHPSPSDAEYFGIRLAATVDGIVLYDTITGADSAATAVVVYISGDLIGVTAVTGEFTEGEDIEVSAVVVGTILSLSPTIDGFIDNDIGKGAADWYQRVIDKVPGSGRVRGIHGLNDVLYAWRNNEDQTAMAIYKSTAAGWVEVPMFWQISFTTGTSVYDEGDTLTQGGVSATVKRVVLESGDWGTSDAAGRLIITEPSGGSFSGGAAAGGGACTLVGVSAQIELARDGVVRCDAYSFTASETDKRLYGCDGVNPEFEFDGTVYVPLTTGMGTVRATAVRCHKNHLFFGYLGSLQHSAIGNPYVWSAVFGAAELGTGDTITNLVSVGGSTDAAALFVMCLNSVFVLYGTSSADWNLSPQSRVQGAQPDSAQDIGGVVALDTPGVVRFPATRSFGNFAWDVVSMSVQPAARNQQCQCSVYVPTYHRYRLFFGDGTCLSGLPIGNDKFAWSIVNYGIRIMCATSFEINGVSRTFYGGDDGWVYEADKGRSFAGQEIEYAIKLHPLSGRSPMVEKQWRQMQIEVYAESAFTSYTSAEFGNAEDGATEQSESLNYGTGLLFDINNYDRSYWDSPSTGRKTMPMEGFGPTASIMIYGNSDRELTHTIYGVTATFSTRRVVR